MSLDTHHADSYLLGENQLPTRENIELFEAAAEGNYHRVKHLLQTGAKPNYFYRPEDQKNSLHIASLKGYLDIVEILIQHGAAVNSIASTDQATALIYAAQQGHAEVAQKLLSHGANIEAANGYGNTALHEACINGSVSTIEHLLVSGAKVNAENHKGSTPLHLYCYGERKSDHTLDGLRVLLENGANIEAADHRGTTPLLVCCASGREDFADFLLKKGARSHAKDNQGRDGIAVAEFYHHEGIAKLLHNFSHK